MNRTPEDEFEVVLRVTDPVRDFGPLDKLLWQERQLLERLAYRLTAQHRVIAAGETRWMQMSDDEVSSAVRALRQHEVLRAAETEHVLRRLGRSSDTSLADLAAGAPSPWSLMLEDHRLTMRRLGTEIRDTAAQTVRLLEAADGVDPS